jgi:hypothetical protein
MALPSFSILMEFNLNSKIHIRLLSIAFSSRMILQNTITQVQCPQLGQWDDNPMDLHLGVQKSDGLLVILTEIFHGCTQSLETNIMIVPGR